MMSFFEHAGSLVVLLAILVVIPSVIARYVVGLGWMGVLAANILWQIILYLILTAGSGTKGEIFDSEALGWMAVLGLFWNWLAVPIIAFALRMVIPSWSINRRLQ